MSIAQWKVPALVSVGLICFVGGLGAGAVGNAALGEFWKKSQKEAVANESATKAGGEPGKMGPTGVMARPGMMGRGMGGRGGRGGGPSAKMQLAGLVTKIDQLTQKPLSVSLNDEKRAKLREQLAGLDKMEELSDDEAKKRMDAILEVVKDDRATLEAAGYRWPGQAGGGRGGMASPQPAPNPFTTAPNSKHLKSLQQRVAKEKGA